MKRVVTKAYFFSEYVDFFLISVDIGDPIPFGKVFYYYYWSDRYETSYKYVKKSSKNIL